MVFSPSAGWCFFLIENLFSSNYAVLEFNDVNRCKEIEDYSTLGVSPLQIFAFSKRLNFKSSYFLLEQAYLSALYRIFYQIMLQTMYCNNFIASFIVEIKFYFI